MKKVFIEPLDVFIFRTSRPFLRGESIVAEHGDITPIPFAGAIRTKLLETRAKGMIPANWRDQFKDLAEIIIGNGNSGPKLKFHGAYLMKKDLGEELFPTPNDVVRKDNNGYILIRPVQDPSLKIDSLYPTMSDVKGSFYIKPVGNFIKFSQLKEYLLNKVPDRFIKEEALLGKERRIGIEIDREKRTTNQGMFYAVEYARLKENVCFSVWCNDFFELPENGFIKLGGESRGATYRIEQKEFSIKLSEVVREINKRRRLKLYFSTPAVFLRNGKNSSFPNENKLQEKLGVSLKLVSALPGKPMQIGGWDLLKGMQKPLRHGVRAGAVYFYEFDNGKIDENIEMPIGISDVDPDLGLGSAFIGVW